MILPDVRDSRFVTIRRGGILPIRIAISSPRGRHRARNMSFPSSSQLSPRTHDPVRNMPVPGCVARSG